jgi:hypothetical protein
MSIPGRPSLQERAIRAGGSHDQADRPDQRPGSRQTLHIPDRILNYVLRDARVRNHHHCLRGALATVRVHPPVCTENLSSGVVVVKSAKDGV